MLKGLDHINVSTADMAETLAFFETMLGFSARAAPGQDPALNSWLYDESGHPVVHVNLRPGMQGEGSIHHVAFASEGYEEHLARFREAGFAVHEVDNRANTGLRLQFVVGPGGVRVELNFAGD